MLEEKEFDSYKLFLYRKGCKDSTIKRRVANLRIILRQTELNFQDIDTFLLKMLQSGRKAKYVNSLVDTIRTYAEFTNNDSLRHLKDFKEDPTVRSTMSDEEIDQFLSLPCPVRHVTSKYGKKFTRKIGEKRYYSQSIFFTICSYTGCRPGEVAKLTTDDILWGEGCIRVLNDKTGKNRLIPIAPNIKEQLKAYLNSLRAIPNAHLFPANNKTKIIDSVTWGDAFHKRLKRLGIIRKGLTPYSLRHSFIRSLLNEDVDIFKVQRIVGHSRIETTAIYRNLVYKDLESAIKKLPLVKKNADPHVVLEHIKETIRLLNLQEDNRFKYEFNESRESMTLCVRVKED